VEVLGKFECVLVSVLIFAFLIFLSIIY